MTPSERKKYIVSEIQSGRKQVDLAKELGVGRAAISAVWRHYQKQGPEYLEVNGAGRVVERDVLRGDEVQRVHEWIQAHMPSELNIESDRWDLYGIKRAVLHLTEKRVNLSEAHRVHTFRVDEAEEVASVRSPSTTTPKAPKTTKQGLVSEKVATPSPDKPRRGRPPSGQSGSFPSLEEMERSNAEIQERLPSNFEFSNTVPRHGVRTGKRAKAKGSPVQKKRKKKRR